MSVIEEFDQLIAEAQRVGYRVRYDYFGGTGGGICQFGGINWLFIDLALSVHERLDLLRNQLGSDPSFDSELIVTKQPRCLIAYSAWYQHRRNWCHRLAHPPSQSMRRKSLLPSDSRCWARRRFPG